MDPTAAPASESPFVELGSSGLRRYGGTLDEERLRELKGPRGVAVYREMAQNHPVIGAMLFAVKMMCRQAKANIEAGGTEPEDEEAREFLESCFQDMSHTWEDCLAEILSMLEQGWAYHEVVYKIRGGQGPDPTKRSRYDDGRIGWRKIALRGQDTLLDWVFDESGGIQAMRQTAPPDNRLRVIPIDKALLFRPEGPKNSPEGRSVLRSAYTSYHYSKHFMRIWGIGVERDLNGIPVAWVPPEMLGANATSEMTTNLAAIKKIVTQIRNDEQAGLVFPLAYNEAGLKMFDLTLMSTGGRRNFDLVAAMNYLDAKIAQTVLADMILIGHADTGSYALVDSKENLFSRALDAWMASIAEVFNRHAVPRLFALNGFKVKALPRLSFSQVAKIGLGELSAFVASLAQSGAMLFPDPALEAHLLQAAGLPVSSDELAEVGKARDSGEVTAALRAIERFSQRLDAAS